MEAIVVHKILELINDQQIRKFNKFSDSESKNLQNENEIIRNIHRLANKGFSTLLQINNDISVPSEDIKNI